MGGRAAPGQPGYHDYTPSVGLAACLAMNAGTDLALGGEYGPNLAACVQQGLVNASRVAQAVTRTLAAQFQVRRWGRGRGRGRGLPTHMRCV